MADPGTSCENFFYCHFHNASKECFWPKKILNFMQGFKSAILPKVKNWQSGTFEPLHEIHNFWPKAFFWSIMKVSLIKNFQKISQRSPNPGLRSAKVQKEDFLKKIPHGIWIFVLFWVRMNPSITWKDILEVASFFAI